MPQAVNRDFSVIPSHCSLIHTHSCNKKRLELSYHIVADGVYVQCLNASYWTSLECHHGTTASPRTLVAIHPQGCQGNRHMHPGAGKNSLRPVILADHPISFATDDKIVPRQNLSLAR